MKRLCGFILCIIQLISWIGTTAIAENNPTEDSLIVGSVTQLSGNFFTQMWGNNTADIDVRQLLHDYQTIVWTGDSPQDRMKAAGHYTSNDTAVRYVSTRLVNNALRYTFTIFGDLYYCNGEKITAKDYVFSILLEACPQIAELGGSNTAMNHLVGYGKYASGESKVFAGVSLRSQYTFSVDINSEYVPYFYDMAFANVMPYPMSVIAPGCDIADDGDGAYITGEFTTALLQKTIMDPTSGYLSHPKVTSGAYMLTEYDAVNGVAKFQMNPYYKGNCMGQKPSIKYLTFKHVLNDTMLDELANGTVDLINKASSGDVIRRAREMESNGTVKTLSYWRTGLVYLSFACELAVTQSVKVRQAIAHCVDRQVIIDEYLEGNGVPVYGYYGFGQWFVAEEQDRLNELNIYLPDTEAAEELLEEDGWIYNAKGEGYTDGTDTLRYRRTDTGELEPLALKMAMTPQNQAGRIAARMLKESFVRIGANLEVDEIPMSELLKHYYRQTDRKYNLFFMATDFPRTFDPYFFCNTSDAFQGVMNTTGLRDEDLQKLAVQLRSTASDGLKEYQERLLRFQNEWIKLEPMIPLYSNLYCDIMRADLINYTTDDYRGWSASIVYAILMGK